MSFKRSLIFIFALSSFVVLPSRDAAACGCEDLGSVADQLGKARAVFLGRIVRLELAIPSVVGRDNEDMVATFKVERRWKGPAKSMIRVRTSGNQVAISTCGISFQLGRRYVIFASGDPLETTSCWDNRPSENAGAVIGELDAASKPDSPSNTRLHPTAAVWDRAGSKHSSWPPRVSRGR